MIERDETRPRPAPPEAEEAEDAKKSKQPESALRRTASEYRETVQTILIAVFIALGIRTFAYEPFNIPSGSMIPTLQVGDYLFVSKFSYGYTHFSFPFSPDFFEGRVFGSLPERGDVAVFRKPNQDDIDYIKRIVGLPGDRIQVIGGVLHINGSPVKREKVADRIYERHSGGRVSVTEYLETLPNGRQHLIYEENDSEFLDNTPEFVVPEDHIFAMGDNRDNSQDSRVLHEVGFVPLENLIGRAQIIFFSHNSSARIWEVWRWPWAIRYGRLFNGIE